MKKSILTLSIAAAIGGLGFAGGALAITTADTTGTLATDLNFTNTGIGHSLLVPYYTAETQHSTLINIVNSDTANGKAVKVRFRGASNSDDVYDFQLFLSPGDVWAASISQDPANGLATLTTIDKSCTKPANVNGNFVTARLKSSWTADVKAHNTREGYVEIFTMADIIPNSALAAMVIAKAPNCTGAAWTALDTDLTYAQYLTAGLTNPTTGLFGNWTIINVNNASAWGSAIPALMASAYVDSSPPSRAPSTGNLVYFPQSQLPEANPTWFTADPLMAPASGTAVLAAALYDLPDMSTPYLTLAVTPTPHEQAMQLSAAIAATQVANEYLTDPLINATTDWVFSMPTRRYSVAMNYANNTRVFNNSAPTYFTEASTVVSGDLICNKNVTYRVWDREENTASPGLNNDVLISPSTLAHPELFCGEVSVLSFNNPGAAQSGVLNASLVLQDIQTSIFKDGWMRLSTPGATNVGLPILGGAFVRATSGASTFGANWDHHYTRPVVLANPTL